MRSDPVPYPVAKSGLDKVVALTLVVLLSPLLALVWGAMGIDMLLSRRDRGKWLYREQRISRGRKFDLLKFRTLTRQALEGAAGQEAHARLLEADPANLTWSGRRILKPWYLDELPQLLNIVRGDMSLVGPRPWPQSLVQAQVAKGYDYRNRMMAGWTGPAQVQKGVVDAAQYTDLDLAYLEACRGMTASQLVRHDLGILWQTLRVLARGEGLQY
jgi:lipopolysaccharide/colanic/teichoic acid biosynthesis glycosyltransferase